MRNPYVTGPYVAGPRHYGRCELIDYLLHGPNHACWVVGNRRIGKTSLLRQLELTALSEPGLVPLFWDMQGSETWRRLGQYLADAAGECSERLAPLGIAPAALNEEDPAELVSLLRRAAARAGHTLVLLCDETEVLIKIARAQPEDAQRLHRALTISTGLRVVAASTQDIYELHDVCREWPTSPFLAGFDMSQTLGSLSAESAVGLITQAQGGEPVRATPEVVRAIAESANNHPYLVQLLCARLFREDGSLRTPAAEDFDVDPALRGFFQVDYRSLTEMDRRLLDVVQRAVQIEEAPLLAACEADPAETRRHIHNLERLGYLRRVEGRLLIANRFLANWLAGERTGGDPTGTKVSDAAFGAMLASRQTQEAVFLRQRLNDRRTRLVELEAVRARDLLDVSPQVLVEIEQLQAQIGHLRGLLREVSSGESPSHVIYSTC